MTSTASQQNPISAPTTTTAAPSYASAAGSIKKASTTPVVASGSNPSGPPVVVGSAQNGKPAVAPVNGRPAVTPAVPAAPPAVARSSANVNGAAGHDRKSSVTIPPNVTQNGGPVGGANIPKFGFDQSPAVVHSTPQPGATQPIPIPSASARNIPSPAQSPAPIPQAISGGQQRPTSNAGTIPTFGSFPGDNEVSMGYLRVPENKFELRLMLTCPAQRTMKQPSAPPNHMTVGSPQPPLAHNHLHGRKDSQASSHGGDFSNHAGPPPNRGGYGRGRGAYAGSYSNMGFPPSQHSYGGGGKGRGNMPAPFQSQGRMPPFPNSPSQARASPATTPAMPHQTPTMQQAVPMSQGTGYYPALYQQQQVNTPSFYSEQNSKLRGKKHSGPRPDYKLRQSSSPHQQAVYEPHRDRQPRKLWEPGQDAAASASATLPDTNDGVGFYDSNNPRRVVSFDSHGRVPLEMPQEPGLYRRLVLMKDKQMNQQYMSQVNPYAQPMMPYGYTAQQGPFMGQPIQTAPHSFHQPYQGAQYPHAQPSAQPMSRNNSQVSERPPSSTSQTQAAPAVQGTPQVRSVQAAPPVVSSSSTFTRPKQSKAVIIKNDKGEVLEFGAQAKPPASPAPSVQSKTPPVVSSTPTPPPKPSTPSHVRNESTSIKTAEQLRNEFKDAVANSANQKAREEEAGKVAAEKAAREEKEQEDKVLEEKALLEKAQEEKRQKDEALKEVERIEAEEKAKEEVKAAKAAEEQRLASEKAEADAQAKADADADADADAKAEATAAKATPDEQRTAARDEPSDQAATQDDHIRSREEPVQAPARRQPIDDAEFQKQLAAAQAAVNAVRDAEAAELLEKEREAERYEEEAERKRREKAANAPAVLRPSLAEMLRNRAEAKAKAANKEQAESKSEAKGTETKEAESRASEPLTPESAAGPLGSVTVSGDGAVGSKIFAAEKQRAKPAALNLAPLNTKQVDPPQPSAAIQSLKSARFLSVLEPGIYPQGIASPNPALNKAVATKGKSFKYDAAFLLQFQKVFTEQPSVEFHQQVKSLIGDTEARSAASARTPGVGPRQGSRPVGNAAGAGGATFPTAMGQFGAKPLPSGLTSEQRFAIAQGTMPRPGGGNPMAPFSRTGGFPGPAGLSRTPSSSNMGGVPNSPRQGSRSQRGGSKRGDGASKAADEKAAKNMPLTHGMDLRPLATSASGWKPKSILGMAGPAPVPGQSDHMDPETVQRKVKAALNKMTPEKFDKIADQILAIACEFSPLWSVMCDRCD